MKGQLARMSLLFCLMFGLMACGPLEEPSVSAGGKGDGEQGSLMAEAANEVQDRCRASWIYVQDESSWRKDIFQDEPMFTFTPVGNVSWRCQGVAEPTMPCARHRRVGYARGELVRIGVSLSDNMVTWTCFYAHPAPEAP